MVPKKNKSSVGSNPATNHRIFDAVASPNLCSALYLSTTGKVEAVDTSGGQIVITTTSVALSQWIRVEARIVGSATVGSVELRLYNSADSLYPTEVRKSAATFNTSGAFNEYRFGAAGDPLPANRTIWLDDMALSTVDWLDAVATDSAQFWTPGFMVSPASPAILLPPPQRLIVPGETGVAAELPGTVPDGPHYQTTQYGGFF